MSKYRILIDNSLQDEVFDTREEAEEYAVYLCSCDRAGSEMLHMSNPGDNEYDETTYESPEYDIIEDDD